MLVEALIANRALLRLYRGMPLQRARLARLLRVIVVVHLLRILALEQLPVDHVGLPTVQVLLLDHCDLIVAFFQEGHVVFQEADRLVAVFDLLFALYVELHAPEIALVQAIATVADDHTHAYLIDFAFLCVVAITPHHLARLPLPNIMVGNVQLRN